MDDADGLPGGDGQAGREHNHRVTGTIPPAQQPTQQTERGVHVTVRVSMLLASNLICLVVVVAVVVVVAGTSI